MQATPEDRNQDEVKPVSVLEESKVYKVNTFGYYMI